MEPLSNLNKYNIKLASGSPRRREILGMLDIPFTVETGVDVDETYPADLAPEEVPLFLANLKADAHLALMKENDLIITADTVVIIDNQVIGKPADRDDAVAMLHRLSGRTHIVVSGVTVVTATRRESFATETLVHFSPLSDDEIEYYVDSYRPFDKAGAYGIQEWIGAVGVKGMEGSFYNVMGLPVNRLYHILKSF